MSSPTVNFEVTQERVDPQAKAPEYSADGLACFGLQFLGHGTLFQLPESPVYSPASVAGDDSDEDMDLEIDAAFLELDA